MPFVVTLPCMGMTLDDLQQQQSSPAASLAESIGSLLAHLHALPCPRACTDSQLASGVCGHADPSLQLASLSLGEQPRSQEQQAPLALSAAASLARGACQGAALSFWCSAHELRFGVQPLDADAAAAAPPGPCSHAACVQLACLLPSLAAQLQHAQAQTVASLQPAQEGSPMPCCSPAPGALTQLQPGLSGLWGPFVEFLRHRRAQALGELAADCSLPPWLLPQLDAYLPHDPAVLLSHGLLGSGAPQLPAWLHGDLTAANLLQRPPGHAGGHAALVDFADAGHGDALYDLVLLFIRGFRCVRVSTRRMLPLARQKALMAHKCSAGLQG